MGLLDNIMGAKGDSSVTYGKAGRHVLKLNRIRLRDPSDPSTTGGSLDAKPGFRFDGELLCSNRSDHAKGDVLTFNDPFKFVSSALARARRMIVAAKSSKTGEDVSESTLGLVQEKGESDEAFGLRIKAELKSILSDQQPLRGAIITVVATEGKNQNTGTPYTLFEVHVPTEDDLKNAGII